MENGINLKKNRTIGHEPFYQIMKTLYLFEIGPNFVGSTVISRNDYENQGPLIKKHKNLN